MYIWCLPPNMHVFQKFRGLSLGVFTIRNMLNLESILGPLVVDHGSYHPISLEDVFKNKGQGSQAIPPLYHLFGCPLSKFV